MKRIIILALLLAVLGVPANAQRYKKKEFSNKLPKMADTIPGADRLLQVLNLVKTTYVVTPNTDSLCDEAIRKVLTSLDPHSIYIPAKDVQRTNEALQGNFDGVGITFSIFNDTVRVGEVLAGGPAEKVGLLSGDRFLRIDGINATGDSAKNAFVFRHLRGKKGTFVVVDMLRGKDTLTFNIQRDKIPIHSVETYFMEDDTIGYIALLRFARSSVDEFRKALKELQTQGMTSLILDLRGNTGGFLDIACYMANEFIKPNRLLVYQEGRVVKRQDFKSIHRGSFRKGNIVVMVDENSASASEIVAGAVQDWDRGLIVGRRTFGKGLVQTMFTLSDSSQIRLTTARYYTPSGRCIQRDYAEGTEAYNRDIQNRYKKGELFTADSIHFPDSLKYKTASGRTVYGGGGIMPDVFVPIDTTPSTKYYQLCRRKGIINQFSQYWLDRHRTDGRVNDFDAFLQHYDELDVDAEFALFAAEKGVVRDSVEESVSDSIIRFNDNFLRRQVKALLADALFGRGHYYRIMKEEDYFYKTAVATLRKPPMALPQN